MHSSLYFRFIFHHSAVLQIASDAVIRLTHWRHLRNPVHSRQSTNAAEKCNRYGKSRLPYDFGYVTMPHGSLNPSIVRTGLYECASTTITLLDRPQANRICESSGVNVKCQHLCPMGISAISCIESAENTWSFRAIAAATKILLPVRSKASP